MSQDSQTTFTILRLFGSGPESRTEKTLVPGDRTLDLPAIAINPFMKSAFHLPSILCSRPLWAGTAFIQRDHRRTNSKVLTAKLMVVFAVVGGICQKAVKPQILSRQDDCRGELRRIVAGTLRSNRRDKQVAESMAHQRQFGPVFTAKSLVTATLNVIGADVSAFQARSVDCPFGLRVNQAALACSPDNSPEQFMESPFFSRRCSA